MGQGRHTLRSISDPVYPRCGLPRLCSGLSGVSIMRVAYTKTIFRLPLPMPAGLMSRHLFQQ